MISTNKKIRVIKREERERRLRLEEAAAGQKPETGREMPEVKEREPVSTVTEWVSEYRSRQHRNNEESYRKVVEKSWTRTAAA